MPDVTAAVAKPIDPKGQLYQRRAHAALPILVRQAWSGHPIYYGDIARELGMTNPRNMNYVLGSVGTSLRELAGKWEQPIPPLQVLAINIADDLPGEGFAEFIPDPEAFKRAPKHQRRRVVEALAAQVRAFPRWRDVLRAFHVDPPPALALDDVLPPALRALYGGQGESEAHRAFKEFVASNPHCVDVAGVTRTEVEHCFPSGDTVDVLFTTRSAMTAVEVKASHSPEADILRGIFQCVKYRALLDAVVAVEQREVATASVLALQAALPVSLRELTTTLGVTVFDNLGGAIPSDA